MAWTCLQSVTHLKRGSTCLSLAVKDSLLKGCQQFLVRGDSIIYVQWVCMYIDIFLMCIYCWFLVFICRRLGATKQLLLCQLLLVMFPVRVKCARYLGCDPTLCYRGQETSQVLPKPHLRGNGKRKTLLCLALLSPTSSVLLALVFWASRRWFWAILSGIGHHSPVFQIR